MEIYKILAIINIVVIVLARFSKNYVENTAILEKRFSVIGGIFNFICNLILTISIPANIITLIIQI